MYSKSSTTRYYSPMKCCRTVQAIDSHTEGEPTTVPKFVQLIKWVQEKVGVGSARVRAPRLQIEGAELKEATAVFEKAMASRLKIKERPFSDFAGA